QPREHMSPALRVTPITGPRISVDSFAVNCRATGRGSDFSGGFRPAVQRARAAQPGKRLSDIGSRGGAALVLLGRCSGIAWEPLPCAWRNSLKLNDLHGEYAGDPVLRGCAAAGRGLPG